MGRLGRWIWSAFQGVVAALLATAFLLGPVKTPKARNTEVVVATPAPVVVEPAATEAPPAPVSLPPAPVIAASPPMADPAPSGAPANPPPDEMDASVPSVPDAPDAEPQTKRPPGPLARELFGAATTPAPLAARAIGFYSKGCLAGARALPIDGPAWQAMRLSRNRNWGHPALIGWLERFAVAAKADGWPGLLVGDISQPRGGPMLTGHASHQVGLDADIWLTPMPDRRLTEQEREEMPAASMLVAGDLAVDPDVFTMAHVALLKRAASSSNVERMFVHPAIKKALCEVTAADADRAWLHKVRPTWGHYFHFHVRITCPKDSPDCKPQPAPGVDDGCGKELVNWYKLLNRPKAPEPPPPPPGTPPPPPPRGRQITLAQLPAACSALVSAASKPQAATPAAPKTAGVK